jgi:hypothetical protein
MCAPVGRNTVTYGPYNCTSCAGNRDLHTYFVSTGSYFLFHPANVLRLNHMYKLAQRDWNFPCSLFSLASCDTSSSTSKGSVASVVVPVSVFWPRIFLLWRREKWYFPSCAGNRDLHTYFVSTGSHFLFHPANVLRRKSKPDVLSSDALGVFHTRVSIITKTVEWQQNASQKGNIWKK